MDHLILLICEQPGFLSSMMRKANSSEPVEEEKLSEPNITKWPAITAGGFLMRNAGFYKWLMEGPVVLLLASRIAAGHF